MLWDSTDDVFSVYATNILVQATEQEFYVSFFEARPPFIFVPEDIEKLESVRAECVARVIISPERMTAFLNVMQQQLDAFNRKKGKSGI